MNDLVDKCFYFSELTDYAIEIIRMLGSNRIIRPMKDGRICVTISEE